MTGTVTITSIVRLGRYASPRKSSSDKGCHSVVTDSSHCGLLLRREDTKAVVLQLEDPPFPRRRRSGGRWNAEMAGVSPHAITGDWAHPLSCAELLCDQRRATVLRIRGGAIRAKLRSALVPKRV
jgi:hypothetical protein